MKSRSEIAEDVLELKREIIRQFGGANGTSATVEYEGVEFLIDKLHHSDKTTYAVQQIGDLENVCECGSPVQAARYIVNWDVMRTRKRHY